MKPTLALAIEDLAPVILSLLALWWLTQMAFRMHRPSGYLATVGLVLVVLGGLLKATAKLVAVTGGREVSWMANSLFPLMAPGFICFGWAMWCGQRATCAGQAPRRVWPLPAAIIVLGGGGIVALALSGPGRAWFMAALTLAVLATALSVILLARQCWRQRLRAVGLLFALYLLITLLLNGMARQPSETLTMEWIKQVVNTLAAAIFALAAWLLNHRTMAALAEQASGTGECVDGEK